MTLYHYLPYYQFILMSNVKPDLISKSCIDIRCRQSVQFSLHCAWLLQSYSLDANLSTKKKSQGTRLKNLIMSGELVPKELTKNTDDWKTSFKG